MAGLNDLEYSSRKAPRDEDEMFCEACHKEGTYATADGFCVNCSEYLCIICLKYHKKYMPSHVQQNKANMPPDFSIHRCGTHPKEIVKFFCAACDDTACPKCWFTDHKNCSEMRHIPTHLRYTTFNYEWKDLKKAMKEILEGLSIIKEDADVSLKQVSFNRSDVLSAISKRRNELKQAVEDQRLQLFDQMDRHRAEVIRKLDIEQSLRKQQLISYQKQLHRKIDDEAEKLDKASGVDQVKLQNLSYKTGTKITDFRSLNTELEKKENSGQRSQLFIAMKKAKQEMVRYKQELNKLRNENDVMFYHLEPDEDCKVNIDSPDMNISLGAISAVLEYPYVDI